MQRKSSTNTGRTCQNSETREASDGTTYQQPTLFAVDFPVNPIASQASALPQPTTATCGGSSPVLFASLDQSMSWLKMYQDYCQVKMDGSLVEYSGTWPRAGMMQNGNAYRLLPLVRRISATAYSFWPTPDASVMNDGENLENWQARRARVKAQKKNGNGFGMPLAIAVRMWPTPRATEYKNPRGKTGNRSEAAAARAGWTLSETVKMFPTPNASPASNSLDLRCSGDGRTKPNKLGWAVAESLQDQSLDPISGQLNPQFVEWLMGFPVDWTALED